MDENRNKLTKRARTEHERWNPDNIKDRLRVARIGMKLYQEYYDVYDTATIVKVIISRASGDKMAINEA